MPCPTAQADFSQMAIARFKRDLLIQSHPPYQNLHLTKIKNYIHLNLAEGKPTALVLLDLSADFDRSDHKQLLECLSSQFGFSELALKWFHSYISNQTQSVKINTSISHPKSFTYGVPQGSVLGPLLFIMYTSPLSKRISSYPNIHHHLYADDTWVYIKLIL